MVSVPVRRQQVECARRRGLSCRRGCALLSVARSSLHYRWASAACDARARCAVPALWLPTHQDLPKTPWPRDEHRSRLSTVAHRGPAIAEETPRRRVAASRPRPLPASGPNQVWAYDFVFDACANGQNLKCLTLVDEWTHEALAIDVAGSIRSSARRV